MFENNLTECWLFPTCSWWWWWWPPLHRTPPPPPSPPLYWTPRSRVTCVTTVWHTSRSSSGSAMPPRGSTGAWWVDMSHPKLLKYYAWDNWLQIEPLQTENVNRRCGTREKCEGPGVTCCQGDRCNKATGAGISLTLLTILSMVRV